MRFDGDTVTQPMEYEPWPSKMGVQVVPALSVFHTPPEPTPTYQTLGSPGLKATSAMRPDMKAGPMVRSPMPAKVPSDMGPSFPAGGFAPLRAGLVAAQAVIRKKVESSRCRR